MSNCQEVILHPVYSRRPVTLLSVLVFQGAGVSIANGIAGGGIAEIRERGVGDFIFGKLTVILKNFQKILCI